MFQFSSKPVRYGFLTGLASFFKIEIFQHLSVYCFCALGVFSRIRILFYNHYNYFDMHYGLQPDLHALLKLYLFKVCFYYKHYFVLRSFNRTCILLDFSCSFLFFFSMPNCAVDFKPNSHSLFPVSKVNHAFSL